MIVVANFSGTRIDRYRLGTPQAGIYHEILNTDAAFYGGGNEGNLGAVSTKPIPLHGQKQSLAVTVPPLSVVYFAL